MTKHAPPEPRIFGYPRVSTNEQAASIDAQKDMIERRATEIEGATYVTHYPEQDSAAEIRYFDRPQFARLMLDIRRGDILIVWMLNRLERDAFYMVEVLNWLKQHGIRLIELQHGGAELDLITPYGMIIALMKAGFSEIDNQQRKKATSDGLQWRKRKGYCYGKLPMGFSTEELPLRPGQDKPLKAVRVRTDDQRIVEEIGRRMSNGETAYQVAVDFHRRKEKTHRGKPWAPLRKGTPYVSQHKIKRTYKRWLEYVGNIQITEMPDRDPNKLSINLPTAPR